MSHQSCDLLSVIRCPLTNNYVALSHVQTIFRDEALSEEHLRPLQTFLQEMTSQGNRR